MNIPSIHPCFSKRQYGLTLIELMVALLISSILMLGVGTVYTGNKRAHIFQEGMGRLQENIRFALKYLNEDVRMAGYVGCAWGSGATIDSTVDSSGDAANDAFLTNYKDGITGFDATSTGPGDTVDLSASPPTGWTGSAGAAFPPLITNAIDGSDVLIIRHTDGAGVKMTANKQAAQFFAQTKGDNTLYTSGANQCHAATGICENDILMVSDCSKARVFNVSNLAITGNGLNITHSTGNTPTSWGGSSTDPGTWYQPGDTEIMRVSSNAYFIAAGSNGPSLFRQAANGTAEELIEGVENMQILYGIDTSGDNTANRYRIASAITDPDTVVSVRISLLLRTVNEIPKRPTDSGTYTLLASSAANGGVDIDPIDDRRFRRVITTTIKLRNKGIHND